MGKLAKKITNKQVKKFFSSDSYDRNLDLMKLLVSDKRFQKIVSEARVRLNIPASGLSDTNEDLEKWYDWLGNETGHILESKEFNDQGNNIRRLLKEKKISYAEAKERGHELDDTTPLNYFGKMPVKIAKQFNIPINFKESIQKYILTGKIDAPLHNYSGADWEPGERPWYSGYIPLKIYTQLTDDEWKEFKHYVDSLATRWLPKHSKIPKIDEYIKVEKVYDEREKFNDIDEQAYLMTWAEISETALGDKNEGDRARDMLRKLEKLRKDRLTLPDRGPKAGKK